MKRRADVERAIAAHFKRHRLGAVAETECPWPQRVALGSPTKSELAANAREIAEVVDELEQWAVNAPIEIERAQRRAGGTTHDIPTHIVVANVDDAASICGRRAKAELGRARARRDALRNGLADLPADAARNLASTIEPQTMLTILKATDEWDDADFTLLIEAARWFAMHDESGLTPRQVPLAGFSAKWLDSAGKRSLVEKLIGRQLKLAERPRSIEFAYLDPAYLASGGKRFDSYTQGDAITLPYSPLHVIIVENKDTYLAFPPVAKGICLFGAGWAGTAIAPTLHWLADVEDIRYWGDMDADGYEILDAYRNASISAKSLLMDMRTYERFEPFGTNTSTGATPLRAREQKELANLTDEERAVYRLVTSPDCPTHRRIEQERIPFSELGATDLPVEPHSL